MAPVTLNTQYVKPQSQIGEFSLARACCNLLSYFGGGLFLACEELWEKGLTISPRLLFENNFKWRLARAYHFHFLGVDQSTMALQAETSVDERFQASYV